MEDLKINYIAFDKTKGCFIEKNATMEKCLEDIDNGYVTDEEVRRIHKGIQEEIQMLNSLIE